MEAQSVIFHKTSSPSSPQSQLPLKVLSPSRHEQEQQHNVSDGASRLDSPVYDSDNSNQEDDENNEGDDNDIVKQKQTPHHQFVVPDQELHNQHHHHHHRYHNHFFSNNTIQSVRFTGWHWKQRVRIAPST